MTETLTIPGAIDIHVHLREPGDNKAETISSGTRGALLGGYVAVCDMPNNPGSPTWSTEKVAQKKRIIEKDAFIPVGVYAGSQPESDNLDELPQMAKSCIGLKLYGAPTTGNEKDYEAKDFAKIVNTWHAATKEKPVMFHAGKDNLEGFIDLVAGKLNHPLHICHVSGSREVRLVKAAKKDRLPVTCGVCPHHIFKTSHDLLSEGWFAAMKPPLPPQDEARVLLDMLAGGDIDVLETDHAPHTLDSKWQAEASDKTCYGVPGIEFALPLLFYQMKKGRISQQRIVEVTSKKPAEIVGLKLSQRTLVTWGMEEYRIGHKYPKGLSGSGWTPYMDKLAVGRVEKVALNGNVLVDKGKIIARSPFLAVRGSRL